MAHPITNIRTSSGEPALPAEDTATTEDLLRFVRALRSAGILDFLTGLLEQRDPVLRITVGQMNQVGVKHAINNLEQLAAFMGSMSQDSWDMALHALGNGLESMARTKLPRPGEGMGIFQLLGALKNPDTAQGLRTLLSFLEGFGRSVGRRSSVPERTK